MKDFYDQYQTPLHVTLCILAFFLLWVGISVWGDIFMLTLYPLYITIILGLFASHKYRHNIWILTPLEYLAHELKMTLYLIVAFLLFTLVIHLFTKLTIGIVFVFDLFSIALIVEYFMLKRYYLNRLNKSSL